MDRTYLQSHHRTTLYKDTHQIPGPHPQRGQLLDAYGYRVHDISTPLFTSDTRREQAEIHRSSAMATMSTFESSDEETSDGNYSDNDHPVERKGRQKEQKESCGLRPCGHAEGSGWVAEIHDLVYVDEEAMLVRPNICIT
jgi:hypothetical protein